MVSDEQRRGPSDFDPTSIKVMTMKVSKGLEFPVVALPGVGHMPAWGKCPRRAKTSRRPRRCFMWQRRGLRRGW
jgi:ATP-dependent exoDNAse (exonuclease V) beta subunit